MAHPCDCIIGKCSMYESYEQCMLKNESPSCGDCCRSTPAMIACCIPGCLSCVVGSVSYCATCGCCCKYSGPKYGGLFGYWYQYTCMFLIPCCYPKNTLEYIKNEVSTIE